MSTIKEFTDDLYQFHSRQEASMCTTIEELCNSSKKFFIDKFNSIDQSEFSGMKFIKSKIGLKLILIDVIRKINRIVKKESDNDLRAPEKFYNILFNKNGNPRFLGLIEKINRFTDFYRIRPAEKYTIYDRKGMFMIPDSKENLVGAYRFNPSGYSCLYLASNLYLAWEECRRPDFDTFNFSHYRNTRELQVLNLTIRSKLLTVGHFIMAYLTLLCCAKTTDKDKHNFQYVVPQLMMKALCLSQRKSEKNHTKIIDGIKYISSRRYDQKDFLFNDKNLSFAYVFPQRPHYNNIGICPELSKIFKLSKPRTHFLYRLYSLNFNTHTALVSDYQHSLFYQMEQIINNDKLDLYDK